MYTSNSVQQVRMFMTIFSFTTIFNIAMADVYGPLSDHFLHQLTRKHRMNEHLSRHIISYGETGSFGGKMFSEEKIRNTPIIFIHGNSDSALKYGTGDFQSGWDEVLKYFISKDYSLGELYGITYGDRNISNSFNRKFSCEILTMQRRFLEFVLQYTKSHKVNIIGHSMGVSIARRIIQGGMFIGTDEQCELGPSLAHRIQTLIGLSGANYGMCPCEHATAFAACGMETGFYPGTCDEQECTSQDYNITDMCSDVPYSQYLMDINESLIKDADFIGSFWSDDDEILGKGNYVWGRQTSLVPYSDLTKVYRELKHNEVKLLTAADQFNFIRQNELRHRRKSASPRFAHIKY